MNFNFRNLQKIMHISLQMKFSEFVLLKVNSLVIVVVSLQNLQLETIENTFINNFVFLISYLKILSQGLTNVLLVATTFLLEQKEMPVTYNNLWNDRCVLALYVIPNKMGRCRINELDKSNLSINPFQIPSPVVALCSQ